MLKLFFAMSLTVLCVGLQYKLWFAPGGWLTISQLQHQIAESQERNQDIERTNAILIAHIDNLKSGREMVEHQARLELGMVRNEETYYHYI